MTSWGEAFNAGANSDCKRAPRTALFRPSTNPSSSTGREARAATMSVTSAAFENPGHDHILRQVAETIFER